LSLAYYFCGLLLQLDSGYLIQILLRSNSTIRNRIAAETANDKRPVYKAAPLLLYSYALYPIRTIFIAAILIVAIFVA